MSQLDDLGGSVNPDFYRRARTYEEEEARRHGRKPQDQGIARRAPRDRGTPDNVDQLSMLDDGPRGSARLLSEGDRERRPYTRFRERVLDLLYEANQGYKPEQHVQHHAPDVRYILEDDGTYVAEVDIAGHRFRATAETRYLALSRLSEIVANGPAAALQAQPSDKPEASRQKDEVSDVSLAIRYFRRRHRKLQAYGDRVPDSLVALTATDREYALKLGVAVEDGGTIRDLLNHGAIRAALRLAADEALDFRQPGESMEGIITFVHTDRSHASELRSPRKRTA